MFPYRFHNAGYSQKTRKIQQCRDTSKRLCRSALSIPTTAFTNALTAAHTQQMLAATQKPQDFKSMKLRMCLCFCVYVGFVPAENRCLSSSSLHVITRIRKEPIKMTEEYFPRMFCRFIEKCNPRHLSLPCLSSSFICLCVQTSVPSFG